MSSVSLFTRLIGTNKQCPFPGAYIIVGGAGANGLFPVYTSMPNFFATILIEILNSKSTQVIVLPGYSLQLFTYLNSGTSATFDNREGTDIMYRNASLGASSCKLSYKFSSGTTNELVSNLSNVTLTIPLYDAVSDVTYLSTTYRCFEFKSTTQTYTFGLTDTVGTGLTCLFLLVGGGGGGGSAASGAEVAGSGGGGAGAFVYGTISVTPGSTFNITVGAGGSGTQTTAGIGSPSSITRTVNGSVNATLNVGGGGSGGGPGDSSTLQGSYSSSGIGGSSGGTWPGYGATQAARGIGNLWAVTGTSGIFAVSAASANTGGTASGNKGGSGGGGAGGAGASTANTANNVAYGGGGGAGTTWPVIGTGRFFAAGGGGNASRDTGAGGGAPGGSSIGGHGGTGTPGAANTGSGGGAKYYVDSGGGPGAGGSGICIIAVPISRLAG
jgi:hypothetical protein